MANDTTQSINHTDKAQTKLVPNSEPAAPSCKGQKDDQGSKLSPLTAMQIKPKPPQSQSKDSTATHAARALGDYVTGVTCTQLEHTQLGHILAKNSRAKIQRRAN